MLFDLLTMVLFDSGIAAVFNSPFVVPVAGCLMILGISATSIWARVRSQEIRSHERLARIAQGLPVEAEWQERDSRAMGADAPAERMQPSGKVNDGSGARRAGVVLVSVGVGLFAFFFALTVILRVPAVLSGGAAGLIPLAIGIGFLVDARIKKNEFERRFAAGWYSRPQISGAGPEPATPPPPPFGMTPAQASDWQPSSTLK
jgi:hypothetical protein